jgi:hypothetical protein
VTVSVQTTCADPTDELTQLADEVGVLVSEDNLTKRQLVDLDAILREKTSATEIVAPVPRRTIATRLRAFVRSVKAWARRAVSAVKETLGWLAEPFGVIAEYYRNKREPGDYTGRHRTAGAWYGSQRSTASRVAIQRRRMAGRQPDDSEPALPEYWVSHMARAIEAIRGHEDVLHPKRGYQFIC